MTDESPRARYDRLWKEQKARERDDEKHAATYPEAERPRIRDIQADMRERRNRESWFQTLDKPFIKRPDDWYDPSPSTPEPAPDRERER